MDLFTDFKKYRDKHGLTCLTSNGSEGETTQNGALFTLEYLICLLGNPDTPDAVKLGEIARLKAVFESLEKPPGLTIRFPGSLEFDSMDNVGAIATFSGLHDSGAAAERIYEHGRDVVCAGIDDVQDAADNKKYYWIANMLNLFRGPRFYWNNNDPNQFCFNGWHGRSPGHIAFLKMTAGKWVGPWGQFIVLVSQFLGCLSNVRNTDARKLPYCNWQFLKKRNFIWRLFYKLWVSILLKQYPNGMRDVYAIYYQDPDHPIRAYSKPFEP